jgi:hypothetical protein
MLTINSNLEVELRCAQTVAVNALWEGKTLRQADYVLRTARFIAAHRRSALAYALERLRTISPGAAIFTAQSPRRGASRPVILYPYHRAATRLITDR